MHATAVCIFRTAQPYNAVGEPTRALAQLPETLNAIRYVEQPHVAAESLLLP